jgi:hypothetical protein
MNVRPKASLVRRLIDGTVILPIGKHNFATDPETAMLWVQNGKIMGPVTVVCDVRGDTRQR